jgi:ElaB/YqjD/DUF883 family membrane-anchored ribosome-binding protein
MHHVLSCLGRNFANTNNKDQKMATDTKREAISERASAIAKDFQDVRSATKQMATDSVDALRRTATDLLDEGRTKAREAGQTVQGKVKEQPAKSVLIAAAIGFLLGVFWVRR